MRRGIIYIGPSPTDENCAQVGSPDYGSRARAECRAYLKQLRREYGKEPDGARLWVKACSHEFGTYYEVVCYFDSMNKAATDYACRCGTDLWDREAIDELRAAGIPIPRLDDPDL